VLSLFEARGKESWIFKGIFYDGLSAVVSSKISFSGKLPFATRACFLEIVPNVFFDTFLAEPVGTLEVNRNFEELFTNRA
jgi:hypothetical protein